MFPTDFACICKYKPDLNMLIHRMGYPDPFAFCSNVGYVLAEEICFIFHKHEVRSKHLVYSGPRFTKNEADLLCQNMPHVTTKGRGVPLL